MKNQNNKTIKRILSIALCLALVLSYVPMVSMRADAAVSDLTVTIDTGASVTLKDTDDDNFYEIGTADELYAFAAAVNGGSTGIKGELTADVKVNTGVLVNGKLAEDTTGFREWIPIGNESNNFGGGFKSNGKSISGLYCNRPTENNVGFIGYNKVALDNINIKDSYFYGKDSVGGIAGYTSASINNCSSESMVRGSGNVGGIVGYVYNKTISNNTNSGNVEGNSCVGGIAGAAYMKCQINNSVNSGTITGDSHVGGVIGITIPTEANNVTLTNASNKGTIKGNSNTGGIAGTLGCDNATINAGISIITNADNTAKIEGGDQTGGIVGNGEYGASVNMAYNTGEISGASNVGGIVGKNDTVYYRLIVGEILNCYNTGAVTGTGSNIGGIIGSTHGETNGCYNIGDVKGGNTVGAIAGYISNKNAYQRLEYCYYDTDKCSETDAVGGLYSTEQWYRAYGYTTEQFNKGVVAYLLSSSGSWGQNIDNGRPRQSYPVFSDAVVSYGYICTSTEKVYTNYAAQSSPPEDHNYVDGKCTYCGAYEPATLIDGIYQISSVAQLMWFAEHVNAGNKSANAILTADIDMSGIDWTAICSTELYYNKTDYFDKGYEGTFDGNGYVIKNLALKAISGQNCTVGLFGTLSGTVKNLGMDGVTFDLNGATDVRVAGIAGQMLDGSLIENCYVVNSTLTPDSYIVGGVAGCNYAGTIRNCFTKNVTISANERCGNLVSDCRGDINGTDRIGTVENCWTDAGRVVGTQSVAEYIIDCHTDSGDMFENGMVAYNLGEAWGQNLDNGEANQGHPVINGAKVYFNGYNGCPEYSNSESNIEHNFVNGICSVCSLYEAAVVVSESNYEELELAADYVGYYAVANAGQLLWYSKNHGDIVNLVLVEDIEIGKDIIWKPLSNSVKIFDGAGHTITIEQDNSDTTLSINYGLFRELNGATVKNIVFKGSIKTNTNGSVGVIGGSMYESAIENVISYVDITNLGTGNTGGLSGYYGGRDPSVINNCAVYADISGGGNTGGIIGSGWGGTRFYRIYNTVVVGTVSGTTAGALVGYSATGNSGGSLYPSSVRFENIYYNVGDSDILTVGAWATNGGVSCETMAKFVSVEAKTAEQFASGEVAYLLQQGNTEQVWGQDSNQEGATPILDSTGLYKVVTVGETGNYSVANVGDTNADGTVVVEDYQALVNKALADDHEQIETAEYDDIVRYDLDGDGYLDVLDVSLMERMINGHKTADVYAVGDYDLNGKAFEEADILAMAEAMKNPEDLATYQKYACDLNADGKVTEADLTALTSTFSIYFVDEK